MAAELVVSGAVTLETVFGLTVRQIESLYEVRQRTDAARRRAFINDLVVGISTLTKEGQKAAQEFTALLDARSRGVPAG